MSYQYKAHGVQALGLKRGLDTELVVSPYASFLVLSLAPRSYPQAASGPAAASGGRAPPPGPQR